MKLDSELDRLRANIEQLIGRCADVAREKAIQNWPHWKEEDIKSDLESALYHVNAARATAGRDG